MGDSVKTFLQTQKDLACNTASLVAGMPGPIADDKLREQVRDQVTRAVVARDCVLSDPTSPLYTPLALSVMYQPPDTSGLDLAGAAIKDCDAACKALDDYCELTDPPTATALAPGDAMRLQREASLATWASVHYASLVLKKAGIT